MVTKQRYIATVDVDTDREDLGVQKIAFTKNPAIVIKGVAFSADIQAEVSRDETKMRIAAPVLVPGEIYRKSQGGHVLIFTADEIEGMQKDFMRRLNNANPLFKKEHRDKGSAPAYVLETWIVKDPATDKAFTSFGLELPAGSWMMVTQVEDPAYYKELVDDEATGFSIEGFLGHKLEMSEESEDDLTLKKEDMAEETQVTIPDMTFTGEDGKKYKTVNGVVSLVEEPAEETEKVEMATEELEDGSTIEVEGTLVQGAKTSKENGTYKTKSGMTITVVDGVVTELVEAAADTPQPEEVTDVTETPVIETYTKEEIDGMMKALREEIADQIAEIVAGMTPRTEDVPGAGVAMSAETSEVDNKVNRLKRFKQVVSQQ